MIQYLLWGFLVKLMTGFDDTIAHIPILASITKTRMGRVAFAMGIFLAIICAILVAATFASVLKEFTFARYIASGLLFTLAAIVWYDGLLEKPREKAEKKLIKLEKISATRFGKLVGFGFLAAIVTVIDDIIAYAPLFLSSPAAMAYAATGILLGTLFEIYIIVYFSHKIREFKYKKEVAVAGLLLLGVGTLSGIV